MEPSTYWLIIGAVMIALEAFAVPGIGLLFGGLAAIVVGALVLFNIIGVDAIILQVAIWFALTGGVAVALWKPMQRMRVNKNADNSFNNIVGTHAKVIEAPLRAGFAGKVSWSGTIMNARLEGTSEIPVGAEVLITKVEGNTVTVKMV